MPNTDLTETTNSAVPEESKKSTAASRILRAVEKSRGDTTARLQIPAPATGSPVPQTPPEPLPKLVMPKIGVDAREALRSLSERGAIERNTIANQEAPSGVSPSGVSPSGLTPSGLTEVPLEQRTVSEILRATKPAVTAPLPGESMPVQPAEPLQAPVVEQKPQASPAESKGNPADGKSNRENKASKSGRHAKAAKAARVAQPMSTPEPKPVVEPKKEVAEPPVTPGRSGNPAFEAPLLGMGPNPSQSFWATMPLVFKAGLGVLVLGLAAGVLFKFSGTPAGTKRGVAQQQTRTALTAVPMSGIGGWTANWGDPAKMHGRSISLFRPSLQHSDYRIEFEAQIESKAFGWVFRAKDPQNYYAYKIETVKPGLQPLVALARITMLSGVESQKHYTLIESPVRPDTVFRVRMDSVGGEFTTRINDQLIEVWQDDRLRFGGLGLFSDPGERAQVRKVQIFEMR